MSTDVMTIVVGYDRTPSSHAALDVATDLAGRLGAALHVVHVTSLVDFPADTDRADWEERGDERVRAERDQAKAALTAWGGTWQWHAEHGSPVNALTRIAAAVNAHMIVVGSHGSGVGASLQRLLGGGSVGRGLVREGNRPVLIVSGAYREAEGTVDA